MFYQRIRAFASLRAGKSVGQLALEHNRVLHMDNLLALSLALSVCEYRQYLLANDGRWFRPIGQAKQIEKKMIDYDHLIDHHHSDCCQVVMLQSLPFLTIGTLTQHRARSRARLIKNNINKSISSVCESIFINYMAKYLEI